jgi:methylated-DNA-[protein]-cysteine S-methyltransferase
VYYSATCPSPVGTITLACDEVGETLTGLWLEGQKYHGGYHGNHHVDHHGSNSGGNPGNHHGGCVPEAMSENGAMPVFDAAKKWLNRYFAGEKPDISELRLAPAGGGFRKGVWDILCEIPYGEVITYGDIAKKMAEKMGRESMSSQAVGGAVGHNPISIIIPCHRVVGSNGSLTGYAGGIKTKIKLLELEGVDMSRLFAPKKGTAL